MRILEVEFRKSASDATHDAEGDAKTGRKKETEKEGTCTYLKEICMARSFEVDVGKGRVFGL